MTYLSPSQRARIDQRERHRRYLALAVSYSEITPPEFNRPPTVDTEAEDFLRRIVDSTLEDDKLRETLDGHAVAAASSAVLDQLDAMRRQPTWPVVVKEARENISREGNAAPAAVYRDAAAPLILYLTLADAFADDRADSAERSDVGGIA